MPIWILFVDYILGIIMWTLIGRSAMNLFQREDSNFFFMRIFVKFTNPVLKVFDKITPEFLARLFELEVPEVFDGSNLSNMFF